MPDDLLPACVNLENVCEGTVARFLGVRNTKAPHMVRGYLVLAAYKLADYIFEMLGELTGRCAIVQEAKQHEVTIPHNAIKSNASLLFFIRSRIYQKFYV
jgi:hypothetical protein